MKWNAGIRLAMSRFACRAGRSSQGRRDRCATGSGLRGSATWVAIHSGNDRVLVN